jgi:hypothetical protein
LEFVGDFSSPRSPARMKGACWASVVSLGRDVGLSARNTEKKKRTGWGEAGGPVWSKKGGQPAGLTQEKLDFDMLFFFKSFYNLHTNLNSIQI